MLVHNRLWFGFIYWFMFMGIGVLGYYFELRLLLWDVFVALGYHICFEFGLCIFDFGPSLFYFSGLGFVCFGLIYIGLGLFIYLLFFWLSSFSFWPCFDFGQGSTLLPPLAYFLPRALMSTMWEGRWRPSLKAYKRAHTPRVLEKVVHDNLNY